LWGQHNLSCLFFSQSRNAFRLVINAIGENGNKSLKVLLPSLYCWEVALQFGYKNVEFIYYEIDDDFQASVSSLELIENSSKDFDIFLAVDFFGIKTNHDKIRELCRKRKIIYFIDQTHSIFPSTYPENENEFVFISSYKQIAIPDGAMLWIYNSASNHDGLINNIKDLYFDLPNSKNRVLRQSMWLIKSYFVKVTKRISYSPNTYCDSQTLQNPYISINSKGISFLSYERLKYYEDKQAYIQKIVDKHVFYYCQIVSVINQFYTSKCINDSLFNSHLFGIEFMNPKDAQYVLEILILAELPVVTWPEKKYIKLIKDDSLINSVKSKIDKLIFLTILFENREFTETKKNKILKFIEDECKRNRNKRI